MEYNIVGKDMQTLMVDLNKGDKFYANPGHFVKKDNSITMSARSVGGATGGLVRAFTGTGIFLAEFSADNDGQVSLAGILPGKVISFELGAGEEMLVEHFAYLASDTGNIEIQTVSLGAAFFGGAGLFLQRHKGPGKVFIHVIGGAIETNLDGNDEVQIEPGHLAAFQPSLQYDIKYVGNLRAAILGGAGLFFANFTGKGKVICHSTSRFAFMGSSGGRR
ncbi:MAG: TIGR00266 family protein [Candidatus Marsarchaeota archaeon]|nr:TIGR00266 family protein [Candidatus Marsarchaeota archaeon]